MKKTVVLGVTSGIAAFKSVELVKLLRKQEIEVFVIMTKSATQMISPKEFEKATCNIVYTELFDKDFDYKDILQIRRVDHIYLADKADVVVVAPATANIIAKIAHGIADDFLTTMLLAIHCPVIICPSMNVNMWNNPATQDNISILKKHGYIIIDPEQGMLACGYEGKGRLAHIEKIHREVMRQLQFSHSLKGKKVIVTAGGVMEKIDDIRFIANKSSGKMGVAIAEECFLRGADVLLLRSKTAVSPRYLMREKLFETFDDLSKLIGTFVPNYNSIFHTAAVSDFCVKNQHKGKVKSDSQLRLDLYPRRKIIDQIKKLNQHILLIAFKAEYGLSEQDLIKAAHKKLKESNADAVVANDIGKKDQGFESDFNEVIIVFGNGKCRKVPLASKRIVAQKIVNELVNQRIL